MKNTIFFFLLVTITTHITYAQFSNDKPTVYIGGSYKKNNIERACYWSDGYMHKIDGVSISAITAVKGDFFSHKVYTAGVYREYQSTSRNNYNSGIVKVYRYWIDSTPYELPDCDHVFGIYVYNDDVYILGSDKNNVRFVWLNGVKQPAIKDGIIRQLTVYNGVVYIAGYYEAGNIKYACYWRNGVRHELPNSQDFYYTTGIIIENNIVYIGATQIVERGVFRACFWINEKQTIISSTTTTLNDAFSVYNGNVYMLGDNCYYINNDRTPYQAQRFEGFCYASYKGKIYIAGGYYRPGNNYATPCFWIGGVPNDLSFFDDVDSLSSINTIYISP